MGIQQTALWCLALQHLKCRYSKLNLLCWFRCPDVTIHQIQEPKLIFKAANMLSVGMLSVLVWNVYLKFGSWSSFLGIQVSAFVLRATHYWIPVFSSPVSCFRSLPMEAVSQKFEYDSKFSLICLPQGNSANSTWMMPDVLLNTWPNLLGA